MKLDLLNTPNDILSNADGDQNISLTKPKCIGNTLYKPVAGKIVQVSCQYGCENGACKSQPINPTAPIPPKCSGTDLITTNKDGTENRVGCKYGCANGKCKSAPKTIDLDLDLDNNLPDDLVDGDGQELKEVSFFEENKTLIYIAGGVALLGVAYLAYKKFK